MRHAKFVGVAELAGEAAKILAGSGLAQGRATVSELPDERTVRYYLTEGLISPAEDKQGTASVFVYRHLLQLLAVKKLQAQHLPIRQIRELVDGRSERELERLLGAEGAEAAKNEALSYLEKLLTAAPASPPQQASRQRVPAAASAAIEPEQTARQSNAPGLGGGTWSRVELEPGLELHVHDQYRPPAEKRGLRRLAQLVLRVIESHGQKAGKGGS